MIHRLYTLLCCFFLTIGMSLSARPYSTMLSDKQLSSNLINNIYQDRDGMIWIATENGLNKYDGTKVTLYCHDEDDPHSLAHNYILYVYEDKRGNFIVGTYSGIQLYRRDTDDFSEVSISEEGEPLLSSPSYLTETLDGRVYAAGNLLCEISVQDHRPIHKLVRWGDIDGMTGHLQPDRNGSLWCRHNNGHVYRLHSNGTVDSPVGNTETYSDVLTDGKSNIYLVNNNQDLFKLDSNTDKFHKINNTPISYSTLKCIFRLDDYTILIGTDGNGIKQLNEVTGEVSDYQVEIPSLSSNYLKVHQIVKDKDGDLWLALFLKGVARIPMQQSSFHYLGSQSSTSNLVGFSSSSAIIADKEGQMWVGTDGEGLYRVNKDLTSSKHILSKGEGGLVPAIIQGLYEDSEGNIWVGSHDEGCGFLNPRTLQYSDCSHLFCRGDKAVTRVYSFLEDSQHRLWIATMGSGLFCYDLKQKRVIEELSFGNGIINLWQTTLLITKDNHLLIGTYNGVYAIDLNSHFPSPQQLFERSIIFSLYEDAQQRLWAAGADGLTQFSLKSGVLKVFNSPQGMLGNIAYSIHGDAAQTLWIGTNRGLSRYNPMDGSFTNYTDGDGLQGNVFSKDVCCQDLEGRLWFGGAYGVNYFMPSQVHSDATRLQARITALYLNNVPINANTRSGGEQIIDSPVFEAGEFSLHHCDNTFSIELSSTRFNEAGMLSFHYSINGSEWTVLPQGSQLVSFSGLQPGTYSFRYKVSHQKNESPVREVKIVIRPYWWGSVPAKIGYLFICLFIIGAFFFQTRRHYYTRRQMDVQRHAHEINEAKLQFFTNITHEIRTPMTLIMSPLQKLINTDKDPGRQHSYQTMQRNASMLLQLTNQLLDIRKIDNGQMHLQFRNTEIITTLKELYDYFIPIADNKRIRFEFTHSNLETLRLWVDPGYFNKIIINLLTNAFKYTPNDGCVIMNLSISPERKNGREYALITVSDTGIGIAPEERSHIFDRFYRASNANLSAEGNGIGLHLTRSLVQLHHGTIEVSGNEFGQGSVFSVLLPLGNSHLSPEEMVKNEPETTPQEEQQVLAPELETVVKAMPTIRPKYHLMIVDDDAEIRSYLRQELSADFRIIECENGQEAIQEIFRNKPDIIISDIMMPLVDGLSLCQRVKENIGLNHIPVILLTAKADQESNLAGLDSGADAYITKPFYIEILRSTALNLVKSRTQLRNTYKGQQTQEERLKEVNLPSPDEKLQNRIMRSINENLSNPNYSVDQLCQDVGISRVHLYRKLKELANQSPRDFIRNIRLKQAEILLLKEDSYSIIDIAEAVGFSRPNNFSAAFKEQYGYPPLQWKAMQKAKEKSQNEE